MITTGSVRIRLTVYAGGTSKRIVRTFALGIIRRWVNWNFWPFSEHLHPTSCFCDENDYVYIVDTQRQRIERFDQYSRLLLEIGEKNADTRLDSLRAPFAATTRPNGQILVTDRLSGRVFVYAEDGELITNFGDKNDLFNGLKAPTGISLDQDSNILVADMQTGLINIFDQNGVFSKYFNDNTGKPFIFKSPTQIACDGEGGVWVVDSGTDKVVHVTNNGLIKMELSSPGGNENTFIKPSGVALDRESGYVYVSDANNDCILIYDVDGYFWGFMGEKGVGLGQFNHPKGIALDKTGTFLYIADTNNSRGQRWMIREEVPTDYTMPRSEIIYPENNTVIEIGQTVSVSGRAVDANFKAYTLTVSGPAGTSVLVTSESPVWKGQLSEWDTTGYAPGRYVLNLITKDVTGNILVSEKVVILTPLSLVSDGCDGMFVSLLSRNHVGYRIDKPFMSFGSFDNDFRLESNKLCIKTKIY